MKALVTRALPLALLGTGIAAHAAPPPPPVAARIVIRMTDDGFVPRLINLRHGQHYVFRFINRSNRGHDFEAPDFFHAIQISDRTRFVIRNNKVNLDPGQSATLDFIAPDGPGRFPFKSTHLGDAASGASGYVVMR